MSNMKVTTYSANTPNTITNEIASYIEHLAEEIKEQIKNEFPDKDEQRIAEIALFVCSKILASHLTERSKYGKRPTD